MIKNRAVCILSIILLGIVTQSCQQKAKKGVEETLESGSAKLVVDESFKPIVDEMAYVFGHLNAKAKLDIKYVPENTALRLLLNDSIRFAVLSRDLTPGEKKVMVDKTLPPDINRFAIDAVALIVNQASADTLITVAEIKKMLNGQTKTDINIVFDNPNSSLVRYLKEFSGNKDLKLKNVYSVKTNKDVIKYISQHPNAIGITGFSWLNDPDPDYADAVKKVKIVAVKDENSKDAPDQYFKPSQSTLALKQYPLIRGLYIIDCTGKMGIASGFAYFALGEKGQRIILRSGILPESIPGREINIKHNY